MSFIGVSDSFLPLLFSGRANQGGDPTGIETVSASPLPLAGTTIIPRELTVEDIARYVANYKQAALNAIEAGFDGVEIRESAVLFLPLPPPSLSLTEPISISFSLSIRQLQRLPPRPVPPDRLQQANRRLRRRHRGTIQVHSRSRQGRQRCYRTGEDWYPILALVYFPGSFASLVPLCFSPYPDFQTPFFASRLPFNLTGPAGEEPLRDHLRTRPQDFGRRVPQARLRSLRRGCRLGRSWKQDLRR